VYRYRCEKGTTRAARAMFHKCAKLGAISEVRGVRYYARHIGATQERVFVVGPYGTARFDGLCWGYGGEGPHGLRDLLMFLGLGRDVAEAVAFRAPRLSECGVDWRVSFRPERGQPLAVSLYSADEVETTYHNEDALLPLRPVDLLANY
jgi:hypothetical protein